jgi:hypothetical protein
MLRCGSGTMDIVAGIDLGLDWPTLGSAMMSFAGAQWLHWYLGPIQWPSSRCVPETIVAAIVEFALGNNVSAISLDGPQGWRDPFAASSFVGRECERVTKTPGKTGTFGLSIPSTWLRWICSSIKVFDLLLSSGYGILAPNDSGSPLQRPPTGKFYVLECFPTSTWRSAGLSPMPGHHISPPEIAQYLRRIQERFGLPELGESEYRSSATHDNVQALVAALPAAALLGAPCRPLARGFPARMLVHPGFPDHRIEGIIWDTEPYGPAPLSLDSTSPRVMPESRLQPAKSTEKLMPAEEGIQRGVRLFMYLSDAANRGDPVGISYAAFIAFSNGGQDFHQVSSRNYLPSDSGLAIRIAWAVTDHAGGRRSITRGTQTIASGMDTYIWNGKFPFDRPPAAWTSSRSTVPYSRESWLAIFPTGSRRLISPEELSQMT